MGAQQMWAERDQKKVAWEVLLPHQHEMTILALQMWAYTKGEWGTSGFSFWAGNDGVGQPHGLYHFLIYPTFMVGP